MLRTTNFKAKPKSILLHEELLEFNSSKITYKGDIIYLAQKGQAAHLRTIDASAPDAAQRYVEQRARGAYIALVCQPEAAFDLSTAAQITELLREDI